jgi:hypothetical protein
LLRGLNARRLNQPRVGSRNNVRWRENFLRPAALISTNDEFAYGSGHHLAACSCYATGMNEREFLVKAQEAEAFANAADNPGRRRNWEYIAGEFRRLARTTRQLREGTLSFDFF